MPENTAIPVCAKHGFLWHAFSYCYYQRYFYCNCYCYSILYPTPQTVFTNLGFLAGSLSFSRSLAICAMTVLLLSRYLSPHTASNSSSDDTTFPRRSHRYHKIENSIGVNDNSFPLKVHRWLSFSICRLRISYSSVCLFSTTPVLLLYLVYLLSCVLTLATSSNGLNGLVM